MERSSRWQDWRWQLRHRIRTLADLERHFQLVPEEREALTAAPGRFPVAITPYYAALMDPEDPRDPLRRTLVPLPDEGRVLPGETEDPLQEERDRVVPGLIHRYPDRVALLAIDRCATYCRYCTRSRLFGGRMGTRHWQEAIDYIAAHPGIRDVLITGGDPLLLGTGRLASLLERLRAIPHVALLRIGSKIPMVLPMRITKKLVRTLRRFHPLVVSLHVTHPRELTPEVERALARLMDAGIMLGSQTVLLRGINDDPDTLRALMQGLLQNRVRPYYLYQCDPIVGTGHFRTPVAVGRSLIDGLRGHVSGYAVPTLVIDAPGGGGKIPIVPDGIVGRKGDRWLLRNHQGRFFHYPDDTAPESDRSAGAFESRVDIFLAEKQDLTQDGPK
ncbi:MAG: KamA family radical SAM protein [Magnetococcales bacterium]|nr:KamA family radical SAM protein [Magnetococcales bacterium]